MAIKFSLYKVPTNITLERTEAVLPKDEAEAFYESLGSAVMMEIFKSNYNQQLVLGSDSISWIL